MTLKEMIYCRKSCRSFTGKPVDAETLEKIRAFEMNPLYPEIKVHMEIVERDQVRSICPWIPPQLIAVYAEKTDGYLENAGFLFQQMDLYLQTLGLGVCWLGLGRMHPKTAPQVNGMQFVILLAFGYPKGEPIRRSAAEFKRKSMNKIADMDDARLEAARLAPSAVTVNRGTSCTTAICSMCTAATKAAGWMRVLPWRIYMSRIRRLSAFSKPHRYRT